MTCLFLMSCVRDAELHSLFSSPWPFLIRYWLSLVSVIPSHLHLLFIYPLISQPSLPAYHSLLCLIAFQFALRDAGVVQSPPLVSLKSICTLPRPGQFHGLPCRKYQMTSLSSWEQGIMGNRISWEALIPPPTLISICIPSCTDFLLSSVQQGQNILWYWAHYLKFEDKHKFTLFNLTNRSK